MPTLADVVDAIHPAASGIGIITTDQVWIIFDRAIDETTLAGNFFVTGPDFDTWSGPDLQLYHDAPSVGTESEILNSPGYKGFVPGTITFERLSLTDTTEISGLDTVGSGFIYRTKAIITPASRLQADTEYRVYLSGDEDATDSFQTGISSRTVFDPIASGTNTGDGDVDFEGGYIGTSSTDVYHVEITTSGEVGTSRFRFWRDIDPGLTFGPFKTKKSGVLLSDGVTAKFNDGLYRVGDHWQVIVKERDVYTSNFVWPFKTGSGSIETIPESTSTTVVGDLGTPAGSSSSSSTTLAVSSTVPTNKATNVDHTDLNIITVTFSKDIDPSSVTQSGITVTTDPVDGVAGEQTIAKILSVDGNVLTIQIS